MKSKKLTRQINRDDKNRCALFAPGYLRRYVFMKGIHLIALPLLMLSTSMVVNADERETIDAYISSELFIETGFAGASITIGKDEENYLICHKVLGSGRPILSSKIYPALKQSDWQLRFKIKENNNFILSVTAPGKLELPLNGYKLQEPRISGKSNDGFCYKN
jgi:hypothetical protein